MLPILLITLIFAYFIYAIHKLDLHRPALEALCKPVGEWFAEAGNPVRAALWVGAIVLSVASWLSPANTLFNQMLPDFISISIAVIVIDELVQYRNGLERKQEIFEQIQSPVRDVAVEAIRLARQYGWLNEMLHKAFMPSVQLMGAYLSGANLQGIFLMQANLQEADLSEANLQEARLVWANLQEANLWGAKLQKSFLMNANLQGSILSYADLREANLWGANLQGANLSGTELDKAIYDKETKWPDGFDPEKAGAILDLLEVGDFFVED